MHALIEGLITVLLKVSTTHNKIRSGLALFFNILVHTTSVRYIHRCIIYCEICSTVYYVQ